MCSHFPQKSKEEVRKKKKRKTPFNRTPKMRERRKKTFGNVERTEKEKGVRKKILFIPTATANS